jgi:GGDEF domain-containing protein
MFAQSADAVLSLDLSTLFVVAMCVSALLGLFLLYAWQQERIRALAWWGAAYLIGGFSVALWIMGGDMVPPFLPSTLLFLACGMIWMAARLFHGRPVLWVAMIAGAFAWTAASAFPNFITGSGGTLRAVAASVIIFAYVFLTAAELWRERRRALIRRWPALFVPVLHGAVFLFPLPIASLLPSERGMLTLASGWIAVFVLESILYVVGTAFILLTLTRERTLCLHKTAAMTDPMTGLFNRRGFDEGARRILAARAICGHYIGATVSVGVACGDATERLDTLLARADEALYAAKNGGRNQVAAASDLIWTDSATASPTPAAATDVDATYWTAYRRPAVAVRDLAAA